MHRQAAVNSRHADKVRHWGRQARTASIVTERKLGSSCLTAQGLGRRNGRYLNSAVEDATDNKDADNEDTVEDVVGDEDVMTDFEVSVNNNALGSLDDAMATDNNVHLGGVNGAAPRAATT